MDYPRVWTSTYTMLEQILVRKSIMACVLDNIEGIVDRDAVTLTEDEWKVVEDLVMVLEPFKVCESDSALHTLCFYYIVWAFIGGVDSFHLTVSYGTQMFITTLQKPTDSVLSHFTPN